MSTLVVAATAFEIERFKAQSLTNKSISTFVAGIGMVNMAINLFNHLKDTTYDHIILAGIAGSFTDMALCSLVEVTSQQYGDLGVETSNGFLSLSDIKLVENDEILRNNGHYPVLKEVSSISVNSVTGSAKIAEQRKEQFKADIEVMEGIAFSQVCRQLNIDYAEIRCISNYVEERNKDAWRVNEAIAELNEFLIQELL